MDNGVRLGNFSCSTVSRNCIYGWIDNQKGLGVFDGSAWKVNNAFTPIS